MQEEGKWKITVHELFFSGWGNSTSIFSTFSVFVSPDDLLVPTFSDAIRNCPQNEDPDGCTFHRLKPFTESLLGPASLISVDPEHSTPSCSWNPDPANPKLTVREAGLHDGAILCYWTQRVDD